MPPVLAFFAANAAALTTAAVVTTAVAGITEGAIALSQHPKGSDGSSPALPAAPNPNAAADTSLAAQTRQRQILLATGGQTDYTGGTGVLLGTDTQKQTLLGGA